MEEMIKLFKNAGIPVRRRPSYLVITDRQILKLLKVLIEKRWVEFAHYRKGDKGSYYAGKVDFRKHFESDIFEEAIAGLLNRIWYNLSESDKIKVSEILDEEVE